MEFELKEQTYRTGRLDAFKQAHIVRRMAPALLAFSKGAQVLPPQQPESSDESTEGLAGDAKEGKSKELFGNLLTAFGPFASTLAAMSDEDVDYVLVACLNICERKVGDKWQRVWVSKNFMFNDIDMSDMIQIAYQALQENLAPFLGVLTAK